MFTNRMPRSSGKSLAAGGTFTGQLLGPDGSAAAPTYSFSSDPDTGIFRPFANYLGVSAGGTLIAAFTGDLQLQFKSDAQFNWSASVVGAAPDLVFKRYAAKQVSITGDGAGAGVNTGWILGYQGTPGYAGLWASTVVPSTSNMVLWATATQTQLNSVAQDLILAVGNSEKGSLGVTAGKGLTITAGTATTDVNALNITQTWNNAAVAFAAETINVTNTASLSTSALRKWKIGGTTQLSVDVQGRFWGGDVGEAGVGVVNLRVGGGYTHMFGSNAANYWGINSGHWLAQTDNAYDIGATGAKPRDVHAAAHFIPGVQTLTDGATINWDTNSGSVATVTLGGNRTMAAPTNLKVGTYILHVVQDATGSRTVTWNSVFKWPSGIAPTLTTTANARDVVSCVSDGTNLFCNLVADVK